MKNFLKLFSVLMLMVVSANQVYAQIKDGEATVTQGSTVTVSIGAAYQSTLNKATRINYTWTTSSSAISIQSKTNKTCTIRGNTAGTARLYYHCSYYIDDFYRTMDFYYEITIKSNIVSVTRIEISPSSATLEIGETIQLDATVYPTNATNRNLNWTTEDYSVASVSSSGLVTARGAGRVWIWARATDGSGAGNYCVVDVKEPKKVASIELSESEKSLNVGETFELIATVLPEDAYNKSLIWSSDDEDIATVSNGIISAVSPGECDIKCEAADGSNVSATCHIIVNEPEQYWLSVVVPNGNSAINVTGMESVELKITPDEGYAINSVTLDGEEQEHDNGTIVLQKFTHNSTLNVVFIADIPVGVEQVDAGNAPMSVTVFNHIVSIKGLPEGQEVHVYDTKGGLVKVTTDDRFELSKAGIYILRIGSRAYKIAVR